MSVFAEDERHFERWLLASGELEHDPEAVWPGGYQYPSRASFGRYVAQLVDDARRNRPDVAIDHVRHRVVGISNSAGYRLTLDNGSAAEADLVVLAVSHPPPVVPTMIRVRLPNVPAVIADPWGDRGIAEFGHDERILIMGTGLTMADVVASLARAGHRGMITAFSRHGLLSRGHPRARHEPFPRFGAIEPPETARALLRAVREAVNAAGECGLPWQAIFDDLRINAERLWRRLPVAERRRFLRHLRSYWDAHRYRMAPQVEALLARKQADRSLQLLAASLCGIERRTGALVATLRPRGQPDHSSITVECDRLVLTTGPGHATVLTDNPALDSLRAAGLIQGDPAGLGILVDVTSHAIGADGVASKTLLVAGPLARDTFGELMGLPQVSFHAALVARQVADWLGVD
jgi:uncharacterized NAD(P)/FAD-binding protein YdhS